MDNFNMMRVQRGEWEKREITKGHIIWQCSECGNVDNPQKTVCSCCRAVMEKEVENDNGNNTL